MSRKTLTAVACLTALLSGCGYITPAEPADGVVTLQFFQHKPEAISIFDELIAEFEAENPTIRVVQDAGPDAETVIRTRFVKNRVPDVMALGGSSTFGELARAGLFRDFTDDPVREGINPAVQSILDALGTRTTDGRQEVNGLPLANNVSGVLYNKDLFARYGVAVPTTWEELIAAAETFLAAGVNPVYATLKTPWTAMPTVNALSAMIPPPDFFPNRRAGTTTFSAAWPEVAAKAQQLFAFAQPDRLARGYSDGNRAFAEGQSAMYLQGSFALPSIREFKPAFEIGAFALPATSDPAQTKLVSGVDVALTMGRDPRHEAESMTFISYLLRPDVMARWAADQGGVPARQELLPQDPTLAPLATYFAEQRVVGYTDHQVPDAVPLEPLVQKLLTDGDSAGFLAALDSEWNQVAARRSQEGASR